MGEAQFGVTQKIGQPVVRTRLSEQNLVVIPPPGAKFTPQEWRLNNDQRDKNSKDQQQLADLVIAESERVICESSERSTLLKETVDQRLKERVANVAYYKEELDIQRTEICLELEAHSVYKARLQDCLAFLDQNALNICRKCLMLRDGRIGIDMVVDSVQSALETEITTILGGRSLLTRTLEQLNEQMRRLRATRYMLDRDLQYKQGAINMDRESLNLSHNSFCLSIYEGYANLDPSTISVDEYNAYSMKNIQQAAREVSSARPLRVYIDTLLKQVIDDLWTAYKNCNFEFMERIKETRNAKMRLESLHKETTEKIAAMQNNIVRLQTALAGKEGYIGLAHTRLGKRAQRMGGELVRDPTGQVLSYETELLRKSVEQLQKALFDSNSSLRYLLQSQIQLEEDINVKMNSLKIDEVDCMTLRATMDYHAY